MNPKPARRRALAVLAALVAVTMMSCAGYGRRVEDLRLAIYGGDLPLALERADALVARAEEGRRGFAADLPLYLLERGSVYQALQMHEEAVADFGDADQMMEMLDLTPDGVGDAAEYLWNDSADLYRPPIYEKLMINVMALSSYLAMGDTQGALVEARRILVMANYFENTDLAQHPVLMTAYIMAGLANELAGQRGDALRFYQDAAAIGEAPGLQRSIDRLTNREESEEIVVVIFSGLPPIRQAEYFPIGAVIEWSISDSRYAYSDEQQASMNRAIAENLLTFVNFPTLAVHDNVLGGFDVTVDGARTRADMIADVESFAVAEWERLRPGIAFAAVTRAIVRVLAREAIQATGEAVDGGDGGWLSALFYVGSLAAQGAMTAADVPDTRTWTMMPAYVSLARIPVEPGSHEVTLTAHGRYQGYNESFSVDIEEGETEVFTLRYLD